MKFSIARQGALSSLALVLTVACGGGDSTAPRPVPADLSSIGPSAITLPAGQSATIQAVVHGSDGRPFPGATVRFVASAGDFISQNSAATDTNGVAAITWTPTPVVGSHTVTATVLNTNLSLQFSATVVSPSLTGVWTGSIPGMSVNVALVDNSGVIAGNGTIQFSSSYATSVSGTKSGSAVSLNFSVSGFQPFNFSGTVDQSGNTITGTINGSGFSNQAMTFAKRPQ